MNKNKKLGKNVNERRNFFFLIEVDLGGVSCNIVNWLELSNSCLSNKQHLSLFRIWFKIKRDKKNTVWCLTSRRVHRIETNRDDQYDGAKYSTYDFFFVCCCLL